MVRAISMGEFNYSHHDPVPALERIRQPVLAVYGTHDRAVPVVRSSRVLVRALEGWWESRLHTIRFFDGADHDLHVGDGFATCYLETVANWVLGLPSSAEPRPDRGSREPSRAGVSSRRGVDPP